MAFKEISFDEWRRIEAIAYDKIDESLVDEHGLHVSPPIPVDLVEGKTVGFGPSRYLVFYTGGGTTQIFWVNEASEAEPVSIAPDMPIPKIGQVVRLREPFVGESCSLSPGHLFTITTMHEIFIVLEEISDIIIKRHDQKIMPIGICVNAENEASSRRELFQRFWRNYELTAYSIEAAKVFMREFRATTYHRVDETKPASPRGR